MACSSIKGVEPTRLTYLTYQWLNGEELSEVIRSSRDEFRMEDLLQCVRTCRELDYKILGESVMVNQASFLKTIYRLKAVFTAEAVQVIVEQATAAHNLAKRDMKNVDLEAFSEKVALHNIKIIGKNIKMIKGSFEKPEFFPKIFNKIEGNKKRGIESNELAQRLTDKPAWNGAKRSKTGNSWTAENVTKFKWFDRTSGEFDGSKPQNWRIREENHIWCDSCGGSHPPTIHMFRHGKVDADRMIEHNLVQAYVNIEKRKRKHKRST